MITVLQLAGLALALILLVTLHYRFGDLPITLRSEARRAHEADATQALDLMKEAVAAKAGAAIVAVQRYEEGLAASLRAEVANAETRARMSERRAADTVVALAAATALTGELRRILGQLSYGAASGPSFDFGERQTTERAPDTPKLGRRAFAVQERSALHLGLPSASLTAEQGERLSEDELTQVADLPRSGLLTKTLASPSGKGSPR